MTPSSSSNGGRGDQGLPTLSTSNLQGEEVQDGQPGQQGSRDPRAASNQLQEGQGPQTVLLQHLPPSSFTTNETQAVLSTTTPPLLATNQTPPLLATNQLQAAVPITASFTTNTEPITASLLPAQMPLLATPITATSTSTTTHQLPQRPFVLQDHKSNVTPFDGNPSRLKPWIQDLEIFWRSQGADRAIHAQQICASIYMHCADSVKDKLRDLQVLNSNPDQLLQFLQNKYGIREQDEVSEIMEKITNLKQTPGESLRDYFTRACVLLYKLRNLPNTPIDLMSQNKGYLAMYYVREGIRVPRYRDLLVFHPSATWNEFEQRIQLIYQAETTANKEIDSANFQIPYRPPRNRNHDDQNGRYFKFFCEFHGKNNTHSSKECKVLRDRGQQLADSDEISEESQNDTESESEDKVQVKKKNAKFFTGGTHKISGKKSANKADDSNESGDA